MGSKHHPYPICLSLRTLRDILDANKPIDCDCFNMSAQTIACNEALLWSEDKFHYMNPYGFVRRYLTSFLVQAETIPGPLEFCNKAQAKPSQMLSSTFQSLFSLMDSFISRYQGLYQDKHFGQTKERSRCLRKSTKNIVYKDVLAW